MKTTSFFIAALLCLSSLPLFAADVAGSKCALAWDPVVDSRLEGYRVYLAGKASADVTAPATTITCGNAKIPLKTNTEVYVTAFGKGEESLPSNTITVWWNNDKMNSPTTFRITVSAP